MLKLIAVSLVLTACGTEHGTSANPIVAMVDGATGQTGPKGDKGDTGPKGDTGAQGVQGLKGDSGEPALAANEWRDPETALLWVLGGSGVYNAADCSDPFTVPTKEQLESARLHGIFRVAGTTSAVWYYVDSDKFTNSNYMSDDGLSHPAQGIIFNYFCVHK